MLRVADESVINGGADQALQGSQKESERDSPVIGGCFRKLFL
jgi:hypothetical protein